MKWMKDPLAGFISRCGARMGKFTALLVTIAMLAGTTGAGATAFADETVTDGGNVAAESAASQPESTQQSDAEKRSRIGRCRHCRARCCRTVRNGR